MGTRREGGGYNGNLGNILEGDNGLIVVLWKTITWREEWIKSKKHFIA